MGLKRWIERDQLARYHVADEARENSGFLKPESFPAIHK